MARLPWPARWTLLRLITDNRPLRLRTAVSIARICDLREQCVLVMNPRSAPTRDTNHDEQPQSRGRQQAGLEIACDTTHVRCCHFEARDRGAAGFARRGFLVGAGMTDSLASASSRASRSRAVLASRRSISAPMIARATLSVISALDGLGLSGAFSAVIPFMLHVSFSSESKKAGRTRPLLCASMVSASTSVVKDQKRNSARPPEGSRPRSCHCDCPSQCQS